MTPVQPSGIGGRWWEEGQNNATLNLTLELIGCDISAKGANQATLDDTLELIGCDASAQVTSASNSAVLDSTLELVGCDASAQVTAVAVPEEHVTGWAHRSLYEAAFRREKLRREEEEILLIIKVFLETEQKRWVA